MSLRKVDAEGTETTGKVAVVKKYANRRLYNTATSSYVTLDELSQMVRKGEEFVVFDAKTGEDITRSVLTQIILEEDSKGRNLLPIGFLRQLIGFYDDSLQSFLPRYLELSMENFARNQEQMRGYMEQTFGRFFPVSQFEEMARQNMALFQRAASMWRPPGQGEPGGVGGGTEEAAGAEATAGPPARPGGGTAAAPSAALDSEVRELRDRMEHLQQRLDALQQRSEAPER